jgi:hypothetical protein
MTLYRKRSVVGFVAWCDRPVWVLFECIKVLARDQEPGCGVVHQPPLFIGQAGWHAEAKALSV